MVGPSFEYQGCIDAGDASGRGCVSVSSWKVKDDDPSSRGRKKRSQMIGIRPGVLLFFVSGRETSA